LADRRNGYFSCLCHLSGGSHRNSSHQEEAAVYKRDYLNTPRLIADQQGTTVWKWDQQEPFGSTPPNDNPSGLGAFDFPLRLPGQYYDKETALHYNMARDYDPSIGRYVESDPIGLDGGLNTYSYVRASPVLLFDADGLLVLICSRPLQGLPFQLGPIRHDFIALKGQDFGFHCDGCSWSGPGIVKGPRYEQRPFRNCKEEKCVDEALLLANIMRDKLAPPPYHLLCFNCQNWSQLQVDRARKTCPPPC
jgi:RHS repeat-associated protein